MNTIVKRLCGAVLSLVFLFAIGLFPTAANGASVGSGMAAPAASLNAGVAIHHHRHRYWDRRHHRWYWR